MIVWARGMVDGDVVLDQNLEVDADTGTRVQLFAVEDSSYPGGYFYRFQHYSPDESLEILRYDNAHDSIIGPHHRHEGGAVSGIEFDGLRAHLERFRLEVQAINERR